MTQPQHGGPALPERIAGLAAVASNLSWSWNRNARALFRSLDPALWRRTQHNPIELLRRVAPERLAACAADPEVLRLYDVVAAAGAQDATSAGQNRRGHLWTPSTVKNRMPPSACKKKNLTGIDVHRPE